MLYVYCPRRSTGAFELVKALNAHRLRRFDGIDFWDRQRRYELKDGDVIVCWGASVPELDNIRVLNNREAPLTTFKEWEKLVNSGVSTLTISSGRAIKTPPPFMPRLNRLVYDVNPTYYVIQEKFTAEYRIHSFDKRSIRAGVKVLRPGFTLCSENDWKPDSNLAHPWIRSFAGGWDVKYDNFKSTKEMRTLAHKAVAVLGMTFGAVDIGMRTDGILKVLEVDRAPRIEGGTVQSYSRAITRWIEEGVDDTGRVSTGERDERDEESPNDDL